MGSVGQAHQRPHLQEAGQGRGRASCGRPVMATAGHADRHATLQACHIAAVQGQQLVHKMGTATSNKCNG